MTMKFSGRETEVAKLLATGLRQAEIAKVLGLKPRYTYSLVNRLRLKAVAETTTALIVKLIEMGYGTQ